MARKRVLVVDDLTLVVAVDLLYVCRSSSRSPG